MKRIICLSMAFIMLTLFAGCCTTFKNDNIDDSQDVADTGIYTFDAQVIESGTSILVAPDKDSNEIKSSDKIAVSIDDGAITGQNGEHIAKDELKAGDLIKITYNGEIRESYPAQITASLIELTGRKIIIDGACQP